MNLPEVTVKDLLEAGGKYLKYSDLLLQKGRLMQQGKNTAMIDKEISKEMKKLNIKEGSDEYEKFFQSALKKFKIDSPADLKTDDKKKEFFNYVDKNYKAKEEDLDKEDETSVKKVIKGLKKAVDAHSGQVKSLTKEGINVKGPFPADTIFLKANRKKFDVILGMYHDQVLSPIKTIFEYDAINITLGLPFIRISPDHGPNEKMIGKKQSNPLSLIKAIKFLDKN